MAHREFHSRLEIEIAERFRNAQLDYRQDVSHSGLIADFVVDADDGRRLAIEVKGWGWQAGNVARAGNISKLWRRQLQVDEVFIVLADVQRNWPSKNIFTLDGIVPAIRKWLAKKSETGSSVVTPAPKAPAKTIFAAMPFDGKYDDTFAIAIRHAADSVGATAIRVDEEEFTGDIDCGRMFDPRSSQPRYPTTWASRSSSSRRD